MSRRSYTKGHPKARHAVTLGLLVLAVATTAAATSNAAFKLKRSLLAADGGATSASGNNLVALPYRPKPGLVNAKDLMDDIGFANVANISKYLTATDSFQTYTGRKASPGANFTIIPGEGYMVKMNGTVDYVMVGAHDNASSITLRAADGGVTSRSGTNVFSPPFNSTVGTAKNLMDDIGFANVAHVSKYLTGTDSFQTYTGRKASPGANFPILRGEAYFIKMSTTVNYTPSHY